jgi:hypothetical protein
MIEVCSFRSINAFPGAKRRLALQKNSNSSRRGQRCKSSFSVGGGTL